MARALNPVLQDRLRDFIVLEGRRLGFNAVAIAAPDSIPDAPGQLAEFIARGRHGSMEWLSETSQRRGDPRSLWPEVRSVIMLGMNYGPDDDPLGLLERRDRAAISVY